VGEFQPGENEVHAGLYKGVIVSRNANQVKLQGSVIDLACAKSSFMNPTRRPVR
jgi:hypothetical protein